MPHRRDPESLTARLRAEELPDDRQRHREARWVLAGLLNEAADEIDRLNEEAAVLRAALALHQSDEGNAR